MTLYNGIVYIAIVGSRKREERAKIENILIKEQKKHENIIVVSGGADGIDNDTLIVCRKLGIPLLTYFPKLQEYKEKGNDIYSERNELIARISDYMYAFPLRYSYGRVGGTMNTIDHFIRLGKKHKLKIVD